MTAGKAFSGLRLVEEPDQVEASLWRRLKFEQDQACRMHLFELYQDIARQIAWREFGGRPSHGLERGDFQQLASQGLLEAIDRFDPVRGIPFQVFARYRISGSIRDGLSRSSEGAAQYSFQRRIEAERLRSLREAEEGATGDALSELTRQAVGLAIGFMLGEVASVEALSEADHPVDPYQSLTWRDMLSSAKRAIDKLPDKERIVIQQHYLKNVPFVQVADLMGLSRGRVSQLHRAGLERIRQMLGML